jgi:hypothetical protein
MHNPDTSYQPNHTKPDATRPSTYVSPTQNSHTTANPPAAYVGASHTSTQQRQTPAGEIEEDTRNANNNEWQVIRRTNRKTFHYTPANTLDTTPETHNRYDMLSQDKNQEEMEVNPQPHPNHKPPPIFIHGVINYDEIIKHIREIAEDEHYHTKSLVSNVIKLNCTTPET